MTRYTRLYNEEDEVDINIAFGNSVGVWVEGRNPYNIMVGKELVADIQKKTRHNRYKMGNPYKWRESIKDLVSKYGLKMEEKAVIHEPQRAQE